MKLSKEKEQEIKDDFCKKFVKTEIGKGRYLVKVPPKYITDFWINKINTELERKETEIVKDLQKEIITTRPIHESLSGHNSAIKTAITIITNNK